MLWNFLEINAKLIIQLCIYFNIFAWGIASIKVGLPTWACLLIAFVGGFSMTLIPAACGELKNASSKRK